MQYHTDLAENTYSIPRLTGT